MAAKCKNKAVMNKEDDFEDWCFVCKEGGLIRQCDYRECVKGYHPGCVGEGESFLKSKEKWDCPWHDCFNCLESPVLRCYTCKHASCHNCLPDANILSVKELYGFCEDCLKLVLLIEKKKEYDSDGERVDFTDRDTYEGLFMEYYKIIKKNERFKLADIYAAKKAAKKTVVSKKNHQYKTDSEDSDQDKEEQISDSSDTDNDEPKHQKRRKSFNRHQKRRKSSSRQKPTRFNKKDHQSESDSEDFVQEKEQISDSSDTYDEKRKYQTNRKSSSRQKHTKSNTEFIGWASRSLTEFLNTIGECTTEKRSQDDVAAIVYDYAKKNKLLHTEKRIVITCDAQLQSLFKRNTINKSRVYDHLVDHFAEDKNESKEDEAGYDLDDGIVADTLNSCKRQRTMAVEKKTKEKEKENNVVPIESLFASIVVENVKLVYLKRSVLKEMLKKPELFEEKVTGCFIRFKLSKSYQLIQVKGVKVVSTDETETILLLSDEPKEIQVSLLSDDEFDENEFEVLKRKVAAGEIERPTVEYLQQKAMSLHKDMINVIIRKELNVLPHRIDHANEKGWRYKLAEYRERRKVLESGVEHIRLLQNVPMVIPDVYGPAVDCNSGGKKGYVNSDEGHQDKNKSDASPSEKGEPIAENPVSTEPKEGCAPEFDVMNEDKSVSDDDSPPAKANPALEMWHYKGPAGQRDESPLFILRRWFEKTNGLYASKFMVWRKDEREEDAIPLPEALGTIRG